MHRLTSILVMVVMTSYFAVCQTQRGRIVGNIQDEISKQPLVGANVFVQATFLGSTTDSLGRFIIPSVPAGRVHVTVSMMGYARASMDVEVHSDESTEISFQLAQRSIETEQIVVTASRREQSLQEVPASISTVTAKTLAQRVPNTLDDALRYVPGVNLTYDQVNIRGSSGYSRGVGTRVLLLFDGMPYLTGDTGEITWETIPIHQIANIEVVKGAGSALYGSSALGGVINVITKDISNTPEFSFRLFSGIYSKPGYPEWDWSKGSRFNSGAFVSYSNKSGDLGYLFSVARSVDESYRENDTYHRWSIYTKLKYDLSPTQNLSVTGNFMRRTHGNFFWWNSLREATRPATPQRNGEVQWNRGNLNLAYKQFISERFFYTLRGTYYGNFWRDDSSGRVNNVSASHFFHTEAQATYAFSETNVLTFGLTANFDRVTSNLFGEHPGMGSAIFAQDELVLSKDLRLTIGGRFDWQRVSSIRSATQLNPKAGLVYAIGEATTARVSFGTGFRYPAMSEIFTDISASFSRLNIVPNLNLKAERSQSYEVGIAHAFSDDILLDAAVFQNDYTDLIEPGIDTTIVIRFDNVTRARIRGAEFGLKVSVVDKVLQTDIGYTYIDSEDMATNAILKFRPRHTAYTSVQFNYEHLSVIGDYRYISRVEAIDENLVRFAPIVNGDQRVAIKVADIRSFYELSGAGLPLRLGLSVTNVFNYHYVELVGNLAPVRAIALTIDGIF